MKSLVLALFLAILLPSCATIFSKSTYSMLIDSTPQKQKFKIVDKYGMSVMQGVTPQYVPLKSSQGFFEAANYEVIFEDLSGTQYSARLFFEVTPIYAINILSPAFLGFVIDPITGAMYSPSNSQYGVHAKVQEDSTISFEYIRRPF